jgi:hypothetical protein
VDDIAWNDSKGNYQNSAPSDSGHIVMAMASVDQSRGNWLGDATSDTTEIWRYLNFWYGSTSNFIQGRATDEFTIHNAANDGGLPYLVKMERYDSLIREGENFAGSDRYGIPADHDIAIVIPVIRHGEHATADTTWGNITLVSNPPGNPSGTRFKFGELDRIGHGYDVGTSSFPGATNDSTSRWWTTFGDPVYGEFANQVIDRSQGATISIAKTTASTKQACIDFVGLLIEYVPSVGSRKRWRGL